MSTSEKEIERIYGKPYINEDLMQLVLKERHNELPLQDDSIRWWEKEEDELSPGEKRYLSQLGRDIEKYSREEAAVLVYIAIQNWPEMVFQLMMEEYLSVVNKDCRRNKDNEDN